MSHLRAEPRPDVPSRPSALSRVGLAIIRTAIGIPLMLVWIPYLGASYFLVPKPFPSYTFLYHAFRKSRWIADAADDWPAPETPEVAWGMKQLPFCEIRMEKIEPVPESMRKGIAICPQVKGEPRAGYWLSPKGLPAEVQKGEKIMMQIHGGGWKMGHPIGVGNKIIPPATYGVENDMRIFSVNYRKCLTPDAAFPAPLIDALAGYVHLTEKLNIQPKDMIITGESSGGYIAIMLCQYLHFIGLPQLARYMLMSPVTDLSWGLGPLDRHLWNKNQEWDFLSAHNLTAARNAGWRWYTDETIAGSICSPVGVKDWGYLAESDVEVYVYYGDKEVMTQQIQLWIKALRESGVKSIEEVIVNGNHIALLVDQTGVKQVLASQREWIQPWKNGE